eukprot:3017734-Pleurochrysis_carterae.AAC.2
MYVSAPKSRLSLHRHAGRRNLECGVALCAHRHANRLAPAPVVEFAPHRDGQDTKESNAQSGACDAMKCDLPGPRKHAHGFPPEE